jgi:hypothetical protein
MLIPFISPTSRSTQPESWPSDSLRSTMSITVAPLVLGGRVASSPLEEGSDLKGILFDAYSSTEPFLIYLREQAWEPLLGFLPFPLWDLKPRARSNEQNWHFHNRKQELRTSV